MINKKFVYGLGIGLVGGKLYPHMKKNVKPIAIKLIKNVIILKENTKLFINELTSEAKKEANTVYDKGLKRNNQDDLTLLKEEQKNSFNRIIELKRQLEDVSQKIDNL